MEKKKTNYIEDIRGMSDKEIESMVGGISRYSSITDRGVDFAFVELQRRVVTKNVKATRKLIESISELKKSSDRWSRSALIIAIVAVSVSFVTVILSYIDHKSDQVWKEEQIDILREIYEGNGR